MTEANYQRSCPVFEIFRETSGGKAFFFENGDAGKIAEALRKWFAWKQSAEMLKAIMLQGAASFSVEVGIKATVNLAMPGRTAGAV